MIKASDLTEKEVINITDGRRLGYIADLDVDLKRGKINAIVVPHNEKMFGFLGKEMDSEISWGEIKRIGIDVILVEVRGNIEPQNIKYDKMETFINYDSIKDIRDEEEEKK